MNADPVLPWYAQKTFWTSVVGIVGGGGSVVTGCVLLHNHGDPTVAIGAVVGGLSAVAGNLGSIFARDGAVKDATKIATAKVAEHVEDVRKGQA